MFEWLRSTRVFLAKLTLESSFAYRPTFAITSIVLWAFAIGGLLAGRAWRVASPQTVSLLLSAVAAFGALFVLSLHNPFERLRLYAYQLLGYILVLAFVVLAGAGIVVYRSDPSRVTVLFAWWLGAILVGGLGLRQLWIAWSLVGERDNRRYPGMRSAPIFMTLFGINYLWWLAATLGV